MIAGTLAIEMNANLARLSTDMAKAKGIVGNAMQSIDSAVARTKGLLASLGVGVGLQQIISLTDQYTKFTAQLKLATTSQAEYGKALADVRSIAQTAQADLGAVGVLYARIANGTRELALTQQRVSTITEVVSLSLKASGATAAESASAMLQLSQAFGSGVLRGQEFNAVNEAAPRLMKALADGIGVPVGQLRSMAEAGQLTSKVMAEALPRALGELRKEAAQVQTIGGAFTVLKNNVMEFIGTQSQANGSAAALTSTIGFLADNLRTLSAVVTGLTVLKLSQWIGGIAVALHGKTTALMASIAAIQSERTATLAATAAEIARAESTLAFIAADRARAVSQMQSAQATIAATAAMGAHSAALAANTAATAANAAAMASLANLGRLQATATAQLATAQAAQTAAMASGSVAATGLSRVLGFLGGPIGAISTLLGLGATAWLLWGNRSDEAAKKAAAALESTTPEILANLEKQNQKLRERIALANAGQPQAAAGGGESAERLAGLLRQINDLRAQGANLANVDRIKLIELTGQYNDLVKALGTNKNLLGEIEAIGQRKGAAKWMEDYATKAEKMAAELKKARDELGPAFTPELERRIREKFAGSSAGGGENPFTQLMADLQKKLELDKESSEVDRLAVTLANMRGDAYRKLTVDQRALLAVTAMEVDAKRAAKAETDAFLKAQQQLDESNKEFAEHLAAEARAAADAAQRYREMVDPLEAVRREHEAIDRLLVGKLLTQDQANLAKLPQSVRELLQPVKNIHNEIQMAWEAGLLTTDQMEKALQRIEKPLDKTNDIAQRLGMTFESTFENLVFGAKDGVKASKLLEAALMDVLKVWFRLSVTEPIAKGISGGGGGLGGLGGILQSIFNMSGSSGIGYGSAGTAAGSAMVADGFGGFVGALHTGGIVGVDVPSLRTVTADVFQHAPRFHGGGMPGLSPGEVPIIAKRGEGVFTQDQMAAMGGEGDISIVINQDNRGADASILARMEQANKQLRRDIEGIVIDKRRRGGSMKRAFS